VGWIHLPQQWRALVNTVMNLRVPWNMGNFLTSWQILSFWRRTLLQLVIILILMRTIQRSWKINTCDENNVMFLNFTLKFNSFIEKGGCIFLRVRKESTFIYKTCQTIELLSYEISWTTCVWVNITDLFKDVLSALSWHFRGQTVCRWLLNT